MRFKEKVKVILKMTTKKNLTLNNVLYVLEIPKNLVSKFLLNKYGFCLIFEFDKIILFKYRMFMEKGYVANRVFKLNVMIVKLNNINKVSTSTCLSLSIFGMINYNMLIMILCKD